MVVASAGGNDEHPSWFLNLRDHPQVRVAVGGGPVVDMVARVATADEREELWPRIVEALPNYARVPGADDARDPRRAAGAGLSVGARR